MKTLDVKLLRELYRSKGLLLAIVSVLTVGVACFVTMNSAYLNLDRAKARFYRQCRMADFWMDFKKAPLAELEAVRSVQGVMEIHPRIVFFATVDLESTPELLNGQVLSLPDRPTTTLNQIVLRQGGYFTETRDNEVIVNDSFARKHGLYPGTWIHLLLNNRRQELFVVGTAIAAEFTYVLGPGALVPDPEKFGVFFLKHSFAEEVFNMQGAANQLVGRLDPTVRDRPDDALRRAETLLEAYGVADVSPLKTQSSNQYLSNEIKGLRTFANIIPSVFLTVAAVVLNVLMTRLARQQRVVVGTLKALGYSDWDVFAHFLKFGLCIGVAGAAGGSLLGHVLAGLMTNVYRAVFEFPSLHNEFYVESHAVGWACALGCAALGSAVGAYSALRLRPAESMRAEPPRKGGHVFLEYFPRLWEAFSSTWRMAFRNVLRNKIRSGAGVFAAAMGTGLMVNGFMMQRGLKEIIDFQLRLVVRSDIDLSFQSERGRLAVEELAALPHVDYAEPTLTIPCTFVHGPYRRKAGITGLVPHSRLTTPRDIQGLPLRLPPAGLLMNRHLAKLLHIEAGDKVTVVPIRGDRRSLELPVVKITDGYMGLSTYGDIDWLSSVLSEEFVVNGVQLLSAATTDRQRRELYGELKQMPAIQAITERKDMIYNLENTLVKTQNVFIMLFVLYAGTIFFCAVLNASLVSLAERQREVATFQALGYTPLQIGNMFLRESMLCNALGSLAGIPLGYLLTVVIAIAYENDLVRFPVILAPVVWQRALAFSAVYALAAHAVVQRSISVMDFQEALKVRE